MRHGMGIRSEAARCFEMGYAEKAVSTLLAVPKSTVKERPYACRALGREALLAAKHRAYSHELEVEAARAVLERRMPKPEAMRAYGLGSITQVATWCRPCREGGPDALLPKPKGRPRKAEAALSSRGRGWKRACASSSWRTRP